MTSNPLVYVTTHIENFQVKAEIIVALPIRVCFKLWALQHLQPAKHTLYIQFLPNSIEAIQQTVCQSCSQLFWFRACDVIGTTGHGQQRRYLGVNKTA